MRLVTVHRVALGAAVLLAACSSGSPTQPDANPTPPPGVVGSFALARVNGQELPAVLYAGTYVDPTDQSYHDVRTIAESGELVLTADSAYSKRVEIREYVDGQLSGKQSWRDFGRFTHADARVHFESSKWANLPYHADVASANVLVTVVNLVSGEAGSTPSQFEFRRR